MTMLILISDATQQSFLSFLSTPAFFGNARGRG